jgi:cGMP-dependent protein kinase
MKDEYNVYFLMEYIRGMELFDAIREIGLLTSSDSKFYISQLIVCIEYLHKNSIIYRDIKPENIMVDEKGYLKLIDMGTAKFLKGKGGKTFTIIGTPHYMAPEIITGRGYSYTVDLWSIGVCLYEFLCGGVPFAEDAEDPYDIYEEIIKRPVQFPSFAKEKQVKSIII